MVKIRIMGEGTFLVKDFEKLRELERELRRSLNEEEKFRDIYKKMLEKIRKGERMREKADFVLPPEEIRMEDVKKFFKNRIFRDDLF
jgi:hypothetical protein